MSSIEMKDLSKRSAKEEAEENNHEIQPSPEAVNNEAI